MFQCPICNKNLQFQKSLSNHLSRIHKDISKSEKLTILTNAFYGEQTTQNLISDYCSEKLCSDDLNKAGYKKVVELLNALGLKRTSSEERKTKRYKDKYENTMKTNYGENVTNPSQIEGIQEKKIKKIEETYGSYSEYLKLQRVKMNKGYLEYQKDIEKVAITYQKIKNSLFENHGVTNAAQIPHVRKIISEASKEWWEKYNYEERLALTQKARSVICSRGGYESSLEKKVQKILVDNEINFEKHINLFNYSYDLFILGDTLVEIQGDMWHGNPSMYKADDLIMGKLKVSNIWDKDKRKKEKAINAGYKLVYLWECEINSLSNDLILSLIYERRLASES